MSNPWSVFFSWLYYMETRTIYILINEMYFPVTGNKCIIVNLFDLLLLQSLALLCFNPQFYLYNPNN